MQDVSNRLLRDFATCLSTRLAESAAPAEAVPSGAEIAAGEAAPEEVAAAAATTPASTPPPVATPPPTAPAAQPLKGGSLFFSVLWERIKRLFRRG